LVHAKVNGHRGWFILDNASQGFTNDRDSARKMALQSSEAVSDEPDRIVLGCDCQT